MLSTKFDATAKLWEGKNVTPFYNPKVSVGQVVLRALAVNGSKISQISDDSNIQITCAEMWLKTVRAAQNLKKLGHQSNNDFGFMAKNTDYLAPIIFASFCLGCPVNVLDSSFKKAEIIHMLQITEPRLMFCDIEVYSLVSECLKELENDAQIFTFSGQCGNSIAVETLFIETGVESAFTPTQIDGESHIAAIVCSSGTTGFPKGVSISHAALLDYMIQFYMYDSSDVLFAFSTLYWISGFYVLLLGTLNGATRIITKQNFSPELQLRLVEQYEISSITAAVHHMILTIKCKAIEQANLTSLKYYFVGGSKVPFDMLTEMKKYVPNGEVFVGYGLTEVGISTLTYVRDAEKDSVGLLFNGFCAKIIDDDGRQCGIGIDGEICLKGNYKFIGYYGDEKATNEAIDDDGFLMTGDIGHFDENGHLYFVDRKKEMLRYCGMHITPSKIESFLINSLKIKSVCVVGVPSDNGDLPAALVVRNDNEITEEEIFNSVSEQFSDCNKLRGGIYFVDAIPLTPSGKVVRRKVKEIVMQMMAEKRN